LRFLSAFGQAFILNLLNQVAASALSTRLEMSPQATLQTIRPWFFANS
jgi:hypothetical protein